MPAMQASTVLLPAPEAPNKPTELPASSSSMTSTWRSRRFLMMCALSMAFFLGQHMHQPGQRQSHGQKYDEQRHYGGQSKALQIHPELHRHAGRIVRGDHNCAEFSDGAHPGDAEGHGQSETGERQRDAEKNLQRSETQQSGLLLQDGRHGVKRGDSAENVITHANVNLREDEGGGAVG